MRWCEVPSKRNIKMHPGLVFIHFDITRDPFPASDVWHCRDCLFHLSFLDIAKALTNFQASAIPYALLTSAIPPAAYLDSMPKIT
jgi:hypothetical protein